MAETFTLGVEERHRLIGWEHRNAKGGILILALGLTVTGCHRVSPSVAVVKPVAVTDSPSAMSFPPKNVSQVPVVPTLPLRGPLSQAQVVQAATDFCKAVGAPITGPGMAQSGPSEQNSSLPPTYWRPCWRVRFGNGAELQLADSGAVCKYFNFALAEQEEQDRRPAGPAISRSAALAKASAVLAAAHIGETLAPPQAQEENMTSPPQRVGHQWLITRRRLAQGVPFQDQQATVILQAETGVVQALGVTFPTPLPAPVKPVLSQSQAVIVARDALTHDFHQAAGSQPVGQARLTWVTPQTHPVTSTVNGVMNHPPMPPAASALPARLAWLCSFRGAGGSAAYLPVDAVTGKVIPEGAGFLDAPMRPRRLPTTMSSPVPPPVQVGAVVATTVPGASAAPTSPPGVPRYRLSLTDIYAPIAALTALGYDCAEPDLGGNQATDQQIAHKLEQAAQSGQFRLLPGPSVIVPNGGIWGLSRTRSCICKAHIFWNPRSVPSHIGMTFSVTPQRQADGQIMYRYQQGTKALAVGETLSAGAFSDTQESGWSWGDAGATTLLCGLEEEHYTYPTGTPGRFRTDGVMHLILIQGEEQH